MEQNDKMELIDNRQSRTWVRRVLQRNGLQITGVALLEEAALEPCLCRTWLSILNDS